MKIYYREKSGGIEILRCFGIEGRVEIPGMIDGKLVISAAPYAFSSHMDEKEELKNASLWEVSEGLGFGREEHVLAGNDVEEIVFPYTLKEIGRYIFYGCGNLKKLEFSDSLMQIGCGAFTGCHALEKLTVHMRQGKKSGVKEMLGEMSMKKPDLYFRSIMMRRLRTLRRVFCIRNIMDQAVITGSVFMIRS